MRKPATSLLLAMLTFASSARAQPGCSPTNQKSQAAPEGQSEAATTLKVDVNLVNVFVTVTDQHGAPVGGLTKENFSLREDDRDQTIKVFARESALPERACPDADLPSQLRSMSPIAQAS